MSEEQEGCKTESKAAIIERPRTVHAVGEQGLEDYQLYGWVKMSAKFCSHIKRLRGAKLSIWLCLALNIDEDGECKLTQKEICEMTGYSHTEVIDSINEIDIMGFLSVDRGGKKNLYRPVFVSKGKGNSPGKETLVKKLDSTPADSLESSPSLEDSVPTSIKKKKDIVDGILEMQNPLQTKERQAINAFEQAFGITRPWEWYPDTPADKRKTWADFRAYVLQLYSADPQCFDKYATWGRQPFVRGAMTCLGIKRNPQDFPDSWAAFCASAMYRKTDETQPEYKVTRYDPEEEKQYVPNPYRTGS